MLVALEVYCPLLTKEVPEGFEDRWKALVQKMLAS